MNPQAARRRDSNVTAVMNAEDNWQALVDEALSAGDLNFLEPIGADSRLRSQWPPYFTNDEQKQKTMSNTLRRLAECQNHLYDTDGESWEHALSTCEFETFSDFSTSAIDLMRQDSACRTYSMASTSLASELDLDTTAVSSPTTPATATSSKSEMQAVKVVSCEEDLLGISKHYSGRAARMSRASLGPRPHRPSKPTLTSSNVNAEITGRHNCSPKALYQAGPIDPFETVAPLAITLHPKTSGLARARTSWYPRSESAINWDASQSDRFSHESSRWAPPKTLRVLCDRMHCVIEDTQDQPRMSPPPCLSVPKVSMLHIDHPNFESALVSQSEAAVDRAAMGHNKHAERADVAHTSTSPFSHRLVHPAQTIIVKRVSSQKPPSKNAGDLDLSIFSAVVPGLGEDHM